MSNSVVSSNCRALIRPDGTMVVSDLWHRLGLGQAAGDVRLRVVGAGAIGIVDYGVLHGEEPEVSGATGTGAVYLHGCPLRCSTCYQPEFFAPRAPQTTGVQELAQLLMDFERMGVHSISLIISTYQEPVRQALELARERGLAIKVVYKYSGLLGPRELQALMPLVDLFVPDLKAVSPALLTVHGLRPRYAEVALNGIGFLMEKARVIVRHLLVPGFADMVVEVETIMARLPFAATRTPLSLLTNFYDPAQKIIQSVPPETLVVIEDLAARAGVPLIIQGRGDYVPFQT